MAEHTLPKGMIFKLPHPNAPNFVKGKLSIKRIELIEYLQGFTDEWLNFDLKTNREGKPYIAKDEWKPNQSQSSANNSQIEPEQESSDLPF